VTKHYVNGRLANYDPMLDPSKGISDRGLGLGDVVAFATKWTGISWAVRISAKSCGCDARRNRWNRYRLRLPFYKVQNGN